MSRTGVRVPHRVGRRSLQRLHEHRTSNQDPQVELVEQRVSSNRDDAGEATGQKYALQSSSPSRRAAALGPIQKE
jgi:hypothetical protein